MSSPKSKRRITKQSGRAAHGSLHRHCSALVERWKESSLMCEVYIEDAEAIGATATAMANRRKKEAFVQCARELSEAIAQNDKLTCGERSEPLGAAHGSALREDK